LRRTADLTRSKVETIDLTLCSDEPQPGKEKKPSQAELNDFDGSSRSSSCSNVSLLFDSNETEVTAAEKEEAPEPSSSSTSLSKSLNLACQSGYYQISFHGDDEAKSSRTSSSTSHSVVKFESSDILLERFIGHVLDENLSELEREGLTGEQIVDVLVDSICPARRPRVQASRSAQQLQDRENMTRDVLSVGKSVSDTRVLEVKRAAAL
jgi:hypothetical protein